MSFALAGTCVIVAFLAYVTAQKPLPLFIAFLVAFSLAAALLGYRVFCFNNEWYRAQEHREQLWYARHPRLTLVLTLVAGLGVAWRLFEFVRSRF